MNYCYVLKFKNTYFAGWIPILEDDEPDFCQDLLHAARFEYSQAQYTQEILKTNHNLQTEIKKIGEL